MTQLALRLEASNRALNMFMNFTKKAMDEINRLHQNSTPNQGNEVVEAEIEDNEVTEERIVWNSRNLFSLGGATYRERAMNIANWLWSEEERIKFCVEPKKMLVGEREPADDERTELLRVVMEKIMKNDFNEESYRSILKHVNQQGIDLVKRKRRSEQKENTPPVPQEPIA